MTLYYCTICSLYPSLYTSNSLDSFNSSTETESESDDSLCDATTTTATTLEGRSLDETNRFKIIKKTSKKRPTMKQIRSNKQQTLVESSSFSYDLLRNSTFETTSEGLCDHVREIFDISRQAFSDYQIKAIKKLLMRRSHPQVDHLAYYNI
jgi:hypothetical protein